MSTRNILSWLGTLIMIGGGTALVASFFVHQGQQSAVASNGNPGGFNVPRIEDTRSAQDYGGPEDKTLKLTIPKMARIENDEVPDASGDDENALRRSAAIHLKGTGFPWQKQPNVYLAGHRLGYPNTESWLTFWDLDKLEKGDKVFVTDADGKKYTYRVFKEFVVGPSAVRVMEPVEGKNVLTLQTCTLPDYSRRLIVRAELVDVA
ncbi:MAG: sortase [Actinobacteria bacterium]|nr:sortase [Actinomycetota bacterium]